MGLYLQLETALVLRLQASIDHLDSILPLVRPLCILLVILDVIQLQMSHEGDYLVHSALLQQLHSNTCRFGILPCKQGVCSPALTQILLCFLGRCAPVCFPSIFPRTAVHKDLSTLKVELTWYKLAQDRQAWRQLIATVRT